MEKKEQPSHKGQDITEVIADPKKPGNFILVGIGASAGGFKPLLEIFRRIPADSGMAYVVILHLSPTHKSSLAELLQKETAMPVMQVQEAVKVEPNHVYVIPPSKNLMLEAGMIELAEPEHVRGQRVPIDLFFRSLAEVYANLAIAVVLSGAGADGTQGMRRIKEGGGLTLVQDPREAEQESMPRSAINAGVADFVLPIAEIPDKLMSLRQNAEQIVLPAPAAPPPHDQGTDALNEVLTLVRIRSGHDFSSYKRSTVLRRIERRLQVNEIKDISSYLIFMREHQEEAHALLRDLLISVTSFFRDPEAFARLERDILPKLFDKKNGSAQLRVWVTGCATGEEAYSMAMLLSEHAARLANPPKIQIFATDIDEDAIARARCAVYSDTIAADVSPERLRRFFIRDGGHYRVKKDMREMVLFAPHNLLRDPPFSKLDLITCRNLLIYLTREIQERVMEIFHFAVGAEGFLFLGSSETVDGSPARFTSFDKQYRIYRRLPLSPAVSPLPSLPHANRWAARSPLMPVSGPAKTRSLAERHRQALLERHTPPSVLVNEEDEIIHIVGDAGRYLHFTPGEPSRNLLRAVHPSLRLELRAALLSARQHHSKCVTRYIRTHMKDEVPLINLSVEPLGEPESARSLLLVVFNEVKESGLPPLEEPSARSPSEDASDLEPVVQYLEGELHNTRDQLHVIIEQYETSVEELRASNEELQAINEELRSATEELETSREELQSVNEELTTLNSDHREKLEQVNRANSDLQNLMASTQIGTIFLDRALQIKRYTPRAQKLFNIIPTDLNRPLDHLTHKLDYDNLAEDAEHVLATLKTVEREVVSSEGHWYMVRLLPYRTVEDCIDGVVLTFIDITERKRADEEHERLHGELDRQRTLMEAVVRQMPVGIIIAEAPSGRLILGNEMGELIWRHAFIEASDVEGYGNYKGFYANGRAYESHEWPLARSIQQGEAVANEEIEYQRGDNTRGWMSANSAPIYNPEGRIVAAVMTFHEVTERRQFIEELEGIRANLEIRVAERTAKLNETSLALSNEIDHRHRVEAERTQIVRGLVTSLEDERRRISRDLHDQLGQQLTVLKLHLEFLLAQSSYAALREQIEQTQAIVQAMDKDLDFLAWELRPMALDDLGLVAALANFVQQWTVHFGTRTEFHTSGLNDVRLSHDIETALYRIAQEALNNVSKHTKADFVEVMLERRGDQAILIVGNDGTGFDVTQATATDARHGMGLISMRERAAFIGGTFEIESEPGSGTTIYVRVPFGLAGGG
jgi:two-component system CheB/CheR fusion protein